MVGSTIDRKQESREFTNLLMRTNKGLNLTCQASVQTFFSNEQPYYVVLEAEKVGGIHTNNTYPTDFIYEK